MIGTSNEILGINRRNQEYVRAFNPVGQRAIADNKIYTKRVLTKAKIQTPTLYKVIRTKKQLEFLDWSSIPNSFVLKPNQGTGGNGIIVFYGKKKGKEEWIRPSGATMTKSEIILHIEKILEGTFSMGNRVDIAIIEERVKNDKLLAAYTYKGVPDVRVIVFNNVPVMAMLRLPTKRSNGTANLHSGAICVGIDMASGVTTSGMYLKKRPLVEDTYISTDTTLDLETNLPLYGIKIPFWEEILKISVTCQEITGLGYIGVDIALDRDKGPVVFEINARPGLGIQVANNEGLRFRLEKVKGLKIKSIEHGIRVSKNLFGGEVEEKIESLSGKEVVNVVERVLVFHKTTKILKEQDRKKETMNIMLDTNILSSRIDEGLALEIGYNQSITKYNKLSLPSFDSIDKASKFLEKAEADILKEIDIKRIAKVEKDGKVMLKPVIEVEIKIGKEIKKIEMILGSRKDMGYPILIGRRDLKDYLIDPSKTFTK
ncbi:RimK/LysX family protein [Candidatus Dojkabacteria bacterium]|jgi:alpha-L-glutamate ligase-like protein|nr:RimK/LysX family protein [Candidatus Dojkabacteria bacterium]